MNLDLDRWESMTLSDLVGERIDGVRNGEICGYGQDKADELADLQKLLDKIDALRDER